MVNLREHQLGRQPVPRGEHHRGGEAAEGARPEQARQHLRAHREWQDGGRQREGAQLDPGAAGGVRRLDVHHARGREGAREPQDLRGEAGVRQEEPQRHAGGREEVGPAGPPPEQVQDRVAAREEGRQAPEEDAVLRPCDRGQELGLEPQLVDQNNRCVVEHDDDQLQ